MSHPATRENNFDLLRLLAAAQVAVFHGALHLSVPLDTGNPIVALASAFPGVPIFFVISGFLISSSWERNPLLADYVRNRVLRIYPGLYAALLAGIATAAWLGSVDFLRPEAIPWLLAQLSIGQFYNPDFLGGFGVGVLNGSLWTIPVELQFYALVPLLYWGLALRARQGTVGLLAVLALSIVAQGGFLALDGTESESIVVKLFGVSIAPYLWMFLLGVLLQRNFDRIEPWIRGRAVAWLAVYALLIVTEDITGLRTGTNNPHPVPMAVLGCALIACAYSMPSLSNRLLRGNDVSYGIYIYHMIVVNALIAVGISGTMGALTTAIGLSFVAAVVSWVAIEKPFLRRKRNALHAVERQLNRYAS